jgi:hypothetical protein
MSSHPHAHVLGVRCTASSGPRPVPEACIQRGRTNAVPPAHCLGLCLAFALCLHSHSEGLTKTGGEVGNCRGGCTARWALCYAFANGHRRTQLRVGAKPIVLSRLQWTGARHSTLGDLPGGIPCDEPSSGGLGEPLLTQEHTRGAIAWLYRIANAWLIVTVHRGPKPVHG